MLSMNLCTSEALATLNYTLGKTSLRLLFHFFFQENRKPFFLCFLPDFATQMYYLGKVLFSTHSLPWGDTKSKSYCKTFA